MVQIRLIPPSEFQRVWSLPFDKHEKLALIADMCRANTLAAVKRAGSGHLGSSFSAMDIVVLLYYQELNILNVGLTSPDRDIYFSSKGHDVPGLYSVLHSLGIISTDKFLKLRRYGGLDGHPDIGVPGIEANSGSLGMGISKGRGMAWAKRYSKHGGQVFVLTGDGEWQEGQNYEALQSSVQQKIGNLNVILDHNKLQSDKRVEEIIDLHDLTKKFEAFGWRVARCNGHDTHELEHIIRQFKQETDRPKLLIADTVKGRGVSFMEHPVALIEGKGYYRWHAGAPPDEAFLDGHTELVGKINARLEKLGIRAVELIEVEPESQPTPPNVLVGEPSSHRGKSVSSLEGEPSSHRAPAGRSSGVSDEYVAQAYGEALMELAPTHPELIVLDADLAADCRVRAFELAFPDQFIENGIAEQDMVSMAGGLARLGLLPVVNSFASFLAARANEQIYNNASELTKIIYGCHYAGLIPAGPGKSHQSIRDISLFAALPNVVIVQPCSAVETKMAVRYAVENATENVVIRLVIGPSPRIIKLHADYQFQYGRGVVLRDGKDGLLFAYGPVMLHEALGASENLAAKGIGVAVVNMPWLNRFDEAWLAELVAPYRHLFVLEDHSPVGGMGDRLLDKLIAHNMLDGRTFVKFGVEGYPACGTPPQALRHHGLDAQSLANRVLRTFAS